jgi:hypothetical protein
MAALPLLQFVFVYLIFVVAKVQVFPGVEWGILAAPVVFGLIFAAADRRKLADIGHDALPNAIWGIIPPLYLLIRAIRLGPRAIPPLVVWLVLQVASAAAVLIALPGPLSTFTSSGT